MIKTCGFANNNTSPVREYKTAKLWSSYGLVDVPVYCLGNDFVVLQNYVPGLDNMNVCIKCVDAPMYRSDMEFDELKRLDASIIHLGSNEIFGEYVAKMKAADNGSNLRISQQLEPLNPIDIHWLTNQMMEFLHSELQINCPTDNGMVLSLHRIRGLGNAYFTGTHMIYGLGDQNLAPMGKADVVAHELGHGIVNSLAGLEYQGESGALNESFADVIGATFEHWLYKKFNEDADTTNDITGEADFLVGEDVMKNAPFMRSMSDPNAGQQPSTYQGTYWADPNDLSFDYGGVHINSGVPNYCFYLVSTMINIYDACRLWIRTLETLSPESDFADFATQLRAVVAEEELSVVESALQQVGL